MNLGNTCLQRKDKPRISFPAKTNLQDHARLCKNLARILHARLAWHVHAICPFSCTFLARFLHNLAHILQEMVQDFARVAARIIIICNDFLHIFCKILQELVQDCAIIVQEKGHIACTCQASLACKILARFLHNLA